MKVCFETFGCRLNKAEALQMEAEYVAKGWELTAKHSDADLIVVRGCSVTARAQADCEKLISHLRHRYPTVPMRLCGCIRKDLLPASAALNRLTADGRQAPYPDPKTVLPTRTARAYLKVQDGCSGKCTFCIVPQFRGNSMSVDFTETLDTAKRFVQAGYHEIVVTGCNLSLYASQGKRLPELLLALSEIDDACRIRLGSVEPGPCALETVHVIAARENVCRFLHLPIQSGSNRILKAMQRPYSVADVEEIIEAATRLIPNLGLGCDLMTGFPDETDLDFMATKSLVQRHFFTNSHVFPYSERPRTVAAALPNPVSRDIRSRRADELSALLRPMRKKFARARIGKVVEIVVENGRTGRGWTSEYLPCEAVGAPTRKALFKVLVTRTRDDLLIGKAIHPLAKSGGTELTDDGGIGYNTRSNERLK